MIEYHPGDSIPIMSTHVIHLYAVWSENPVYKVTFKLDGGKVDGKTDDVVKTVVKGEYVTPPTPGKDSDSKYSYRFTGWDKDVVNPVNADATYTAQWEKTPIDYNITYNLDGGSLNAGESNPTKYNVETDTFTLKNPVKTGYDFAGWTSENDTTKETTVSVEKGTTGDLKFTAHWTPKSYTITYVYNGGTEVQGDSFNGYGGAVKNDTGLVFTRSYGDAMPAFPTGLSLEKASVQPKDYTFDGWDNDYETKISGTVPAENVTFTAQYSETDRSYNVTAIVHNGTISNDSATGLWNFIWGNNVTVSYEPYEGYELSSVKVTKGDGEEEEVYANDIFKRYKDSYSINSLDADYTIEVTYTKIQYKVTFDLNGGKVGDSTDNIEQTVGWGEKATAPAPLKEEDAGYTYKLAGWKNGEVVYSGDTINNTEVKANVTYVAQWTPVAKEFKISYNGLEGASVSGNPTTYKIVSADIKLNNPSKTGYTFVGWDDDATEAEEKLKESDVAIQSGSTGDKSFTAIWKKNASTLQLNPNGGEFAEGTKTEYDGVYGDTLNNIPTPTRVGYTFDGWTKSVDFYGTLENGVYTFGATDGAVDVLTANWKNIEYTITFKNVYTDGQGNVDVVVATNHEGTYHYGDPVIRPTKEQEPTRRSTATENYTFAGWAAQENGTVLENIPDVTEDAIYYAVYKASPRYVGYTVQYYLQTERNNTDKETYEYVKADDVVVAYDATNNTAQAGSSLATDKLAEYAKKTYAGYAYDSTMTVNQGFSTNDDTNIVKLYYNLVDYKVVLDANGGTVQLSETEQKAYNDAKVYYEVDENGTTSELIYTVKSENFNLPVEPSISNMGQTFLGWQQVDAQGVWEAIVALFTPKAEVVTITVDADNSLVMTYKANWKGNTGTSLYVLLPGHELGKDINEVTAKERSGRKNFSSNYYTAKLGTVDVASNLTDTFKGAYYERQPDGDFGTSVEAYMSGHQYQNSSNLDGTTLKVNDYKGYSYTADINSVDWYVVKDSSTSNTPNWHVDGLPNWEKGAAVNYTLAIDLNDSDNYEASVEGEVYATKNGNPVNSTNTTYTVEDTVIITNPTRPGYTFEGWKAYYTNGGAQYKNYDGKVAAASVSKGTTGNLTFVAQWKADEYTIKYQTYNNATSAFINDNLATKSFNVENVADISFAVIAPAYDGLAFKGWYTEGGDLLTTETEIPTTSVLKQADPELKGAYQNATVVARYNDATMTVSAKDVTKVYSTYWMSSDVNPVASVEGATIQFFSEKKYYDQAVAGGAIEHIRKEGNMRVRDVDERTEYFVATKDGYEPAFGSAEFTITKRPLVLQANSATKKYDGKILSDTGYKVITETQNIDGVEVTGLEMPTCLGGDTKYKISLNVTTNGSQLYGGSSKNVIETWSMTVDNVSNRNEAENYEVYLLPGTLEVTKGEIAITVEASDDTKVYDGTALTANSYKALSEEDAKKLSDAGDHIVVTVEGSATLVSDSVAGNNQVTDVKVYHGDGTANDVTENYNINTQDGTLTITAKPIVLTAANVSKQYDGKPFDLSTLRNPVFTVADAAVDGEGKVVISDGHAIAEAGTTGVVGDQYVVPESVSLQVEPIVAGEGKTTLDASGIMIYAPAGVPMLLADDLDDVTGTMNGNYEIYYAPGTVSITNENPVEVTLTAASGTFTYNGSTFTIDSYARAAQDGFEPDSAIDNWTFTVVDGDEEYEIQVNTSATAVGTYTVPFTYVNADGEVVAVTEDDEIKVYDGVIGTEGTNDVTKYIKVTLVNGSILINAAPAQGGGGGGRRAAAATQTGDVLGARREDEALLEEGEVLGATRAPKTSDSAKAILWMLVMGGSALGAAAILAQRKKEEQK
ncbi:MAG: InlB B-repeat-containing protein [Lachnospiraceae bacterium]